MGTPHDRRHRPQPRVRPAPVVPGGAGRRARVARAGPVLVPARAAGPAATSRPTTGCPSSRGVPWTRTKNDDGTPGRVVPPPVHARAARPQLDPPRRAPRARGRAAVLVRPRRGRRAHRLGRARGQGPRAARRRPRRRARARRPADQRLPTRRAPLHRPRRAPRHLRLVAPSRRRLRRAAAARRRGVDARRRAADALPPPDRAAHGVQPRLPHLPVGPRPPAPQHRHHPGHARRRRRPGHLGHLQPRRHPAGHPLRPGRQLVLVRRQAGRDPDRPRTRAAAGPGGRPAGHGAARVASTSTRARSWGCPRSRTSSRTSSRTRCTSVRAASTPAATAPGCRCRGRATAAAVRVQPRRRRRPSRGCPSPPTGTALTVEAQIGDPDSTLELYRAALRIRRAERRPRRRAPLRWLDGDRRVLAFARGDAVRLRGEPLRRPRRPARARRGAAGQRSARSTAAGSPPTPPPGCGCRRPPAPRPVLPTARPPPTTTTARQRHRQQPDIAATGGTPENGARHEEHPHAHRRRRWWSRWPWASWPPAATTTEAATTPPPERRRGHHQRQQPAARDRARDPGGVPDPGRGVRGRQPRHHGRRPGMGVGRHDVRLAARRQHAADDLRDPVHLRPDPDRARPAAGHHGRVRGPAVRRRLQPRRAAGGRGRRQGLRRPHRGLRHGPALQPGDVRGCRARPRPAAHVVGRGP